MSNRRTVRMRRSDGNIDSRIYFGDGTFAQPGAADGVIEVPLGQDVGAMVAAGYEHAPITNSRE